MNTEKKLGVLVCTIDKKLEKVVRSLLPQLSKCHTTISHQITDDATYDTSFVGARVAYAPVRSVGLSRNRNHALAQASQDINLISDDDVQYVSDFESRILHEYEAHKETDIITFRADRGHHQKKERQDHFVHDKWSIRKVSSIGITFRKSSIEHAGITFDERFGLGATHISGEEHIFLKDCLDAGLVVMHVDVPIVRHTHLSSAWVWNKAQVRSKVAVMWRLYGPFVALGAIGWFAFKKRPLYKDHMNIVTFFAVSLRSFVSVAISGF